MTEYLPWAFALLVFGMMAWPIMQLMPTDAQKRRIAIRQQAVDAGLSVSLEKIHLPDALADVIDQVSDGKLDTRLSGML